MELIPQVGDNIYWIVAMTIFIYLISLFFFIKIVTNLLFRGKYLMFLIAVVLFAILYTSVSNIVYYLYMDDYNFFSKNIISDNISAISLYILCISGVIIPVFLKNWITSREHLDLLKIKQKSSAVEQFKEQINPPVFFKILHESKFLVQINPDKASSMLIKLSQLIRYQLYDCNRDQVLLSAEINFIQNFLDLEKLSSPKFDYVLQTEGKMHGVFVAPSIVLPYIQAVVNALNSNSRNPKIDIRIIHINSKISIVASTPDISNNILLNKELLKSKERLGILYKNRYTLIIDNSSNKGVTNIVLELEIQ